MERAGIDQPIEGTSQQGNPANHSPNTGPLMADSFLSLSTSSSPLIVENRRRSARLAAAPRHLYVDNLHRCDIRTGTYNEWVPNSSCERANSPRLLLGPTTLPATWRAGRGLFIGDIGNKRLEEGAYICDYEGEVFPFHSQAQAYARNHGLSDRITEVVEGQFVVGHANNAAAFANDPLDHSLVNAEIAAVRDSRTQKGMSRLALFHLRTAPPLCSFDEIFIAYGGHYFLNDIQRYDLDSVLSAYPSMYSRIQVTQMREQGQPTHVRRRAYPFTLYQPRLENKDESPPRSFAVETAESPSSTSARTHEELEIMTKSPPFRHLLLGGASRESRRFPSPPHEMLDYGDENVQDPSALPPPAPVVQPQTPLQLQQQPLVQQPQVPQVYSQLQPFQPQIRHQLELQPLQAQRNPRRQPHEASDSSASERQKRDMSSREEHAAYARQPQTYTKKRRGDDPYRDAPYHDAPYREAPHRNAPPYEVSLDSRRQTTGRDRERGDSRDRFRGSQRGDSRDQSRDYRTRQGHDWEYRQDSHRDSYTSGSASEISHRYAPQYSDDRGRYDSRYDSRDSRESQGRFRRDSRDPYDDRKGYDSRDRKEYLGERRWEDREADEESAPLSGVPFPTASVTLGPPYRTDGAIIEASVRDPDYYVLNLFNGPCPHPEYPYISMAQVEDAMAPLFLNQEKLQRFLQAGTTKLAATSSSTLYPDAIGVADVPPLTSSQPQSPASTSPPPPRLTLHEEVLMRRPVTSSQEAPPAAITFSTIGQLQSSGIVSSLLPQSSQPAPVTLPSVDSF